MNPGAKGPDLFIRPDGVHTIGQHNNRNLSIEIHPEGRPGKPQVADALRREVHPGARTLSGGHIPAERPRTTSDGILLGQELFYRLRIEVVFSPLQVVLPDQVHDSPNLIGRAEQARMSRVAAKGKGVIVVDFTL